VNTLVELMQKERRETFFTVIENLAFALGLIAHALAEKIPFFLLS